MINGVTVADTVTFAYTTDWTMWQETPALEVQLAAGSNFIQLAALGASGLANIDYIKVLGDGITPDNPSFSLDGRDQRSGGGQRDAGRRCRRSIRPARR